MRGRVRVTSKGLSLVLASDRPGCARGSFDSRSVSWHPELDDHVFTVEVEEWVSQFKRGAPAKGSEEDSGAASAVAACASGECSG